MDASAVFPPPVLESLFNHVALPPRLPAKEENSIEQIEHALTVRLLDASRVLRDLSNHEFGGHWDCMRLVIQSCKAMNRGGRINKTSILAEFRSLAPKNLLILHITEQNAGLLIRRHHDVQGETVIFEGFEASPSSERVLASENALQWDFPGCAVAIPFSEFTNDSFQNNLAAFLEQASTESIKRFAARTNKAGSSICESRDTADPSLITEMLMTLLEVNGYRIFPALMRKRVRDDVCWTNGAENPWRRCPFWLVLRVGVQRHLYTLLGVEAGRVYYKFLICLVLARLIDDTLDHLSPESLAFLKGKLCRRLVKLEVDKDAASHRIRAVYEYMFTTLGPLFHKTTRIVTEHIKARWANFKKTIQRPIQYLPPRADQRDLYLTLPNSGLYLQQVLAEALYTDTASPSQKTHQLPIKYQDSTSTTIRLSAFTKCCFSLSEIEKNIKTGRAAALASELSSEDECMRFAREINAYLSAVAGTYDNNPEQKSIMILTVMEIWISMDECATKLFGLLEDYNPGFPAEILNVLQLPHFQDMLRLQKIQNYLQDRHVKCKNSRMTLFEDPMKGCFAERYFDESERLQELQQRIETAAELARKKKEEEWLRLSAEYQDVVRAIAESSCLFTTDENRPFLTIHDDRQCRKCFLQRKERRIKIEIHEHPLPSNPIQAKAVVFELGCPRAFAAYRDTTWRILGTLARPRQINSLEPRVLLRDYSELKAFMTLGKCNLSLASTTKSFLESHYSTIRFPVSLEEVYRPNGLKLGYFDTIAATWSGRQAQKPTFAHHCQIILPISSPFSSLQFLPDFAVDANGPSSYEVVASQTRCPSGINVHEYMAYQALFSGRNRRWLAILIELGSSNLNFSTEATTLLISQLAFQVGPACEVDPLRAVHRVFRDKSFCERLIEQLHRRLEGISSNWREMHCMEMLVFLILRVCSLASECTIINTAVDLLAKARQATFQWIGLLRAEIRKAVDADTSRRCSMYAFWAALLCRRTFALYMQSEDILEPTALRCFIECSITFQDNLVGDPASLSPRLRNALIRDLKMVYQMRFILSRSLEASPKSLMAAVNIVLPESEGGSARSSSRLEFLPQPHEWWIQATIEATQQTTQQTVHYHLLEGHLLIDGKPVGKLPAEYRNSFVLRELFGEQSLLTYPSGLRGMTYVLPMKMCGHQIHLGFRNGNLIVRACIRNTTLELVPHEVFGSPPNFDLPSPLVENCVHWLDLSTGNMEVRKKPDIWRSKESNWRVNIKARQAKRRTVSLVDPQSPLFQRVARLFDRFEYRHHLTVFQPAYRSLSVELRRLELIFVVNRKGLLESPQLRSEIDPDQDAGTWYGLNSKLVLRDAVNPRQRSIIVPTGSIIHKRNGLHVAVDVANEGNYGRFTINDVLGRLDCPTEPLLLYLKAQLHAYTSFIVPDPLTGLTGTEESLHCLKSGQCQPWTPLRSGPHQILISIAKLTPKRCYYPRDMKVMQEVFWDENLTVTIQHDGFGPIIEEICRKSRQLSIFAFQNTELPPPEPAGDTHLLCRSYSRRHLYERLSLDSSGEQVAPDLLYDARDRCRNSQGRINVFEATSLIRNWASKLPTTPDLAGILQNWPTIGGYDRSFNEILLSNRLAIEFAPEWGSLVNLCRNAKPEDKFQLIFLFAVMSFRIDVDMDILRTLIAFAVLEDLKELCPPKWPSYIQFRQNQNPRVEYLVQLMKNCRLPYPGDERSTLQFILSSKQRRKLIEAELAHERNTENDCKALAQSLLDQWPCLEPTIEIFSRSEWVNIDQAMEIIRPEWERLFQNMELSCHIQQVQLVLDCHRTEERIEPPKIRPEGQEMLSMQYRAGDLLPARNLLQNTGPNLSGMLPALSDGNKAPVASKDLRSALAKSTNEHIPYSSQGPMQTLHAKFTPSAFLEIYELQGIISTMQESQSTVRQQYGRDLMQSLNVLKTLKGAPKNDEILMSPAILSTEISQAQETLKKQFDQICDAFERSDSRAHWLQKGSLWPCITPVTLLEQLRSTLASTFGVRMKESLVLYATSITTLQRLLRIEAAYRKGDSQKSKEEKENMGHGNWQPLKYPDWLLLEIDANILIRPGQVDVALATIFPASESNSVLQMNMGQGKTSCIMPMVAAVLADTKKLLRVVVPKPLLLQTAQLLQARLGGLLGREVRHVPFARKTSTKPDIITEFYNIHSEILKSSGVMLALPEHILSFTLSGLQRLSDGRLSEAKQMVRVNTKIKRLSRDVLDESDITLAVRTQLIYPSGAQNTVDGHPYRWETAEALLGLVEGHLWNLQHDFPQSLEVVRRPSSGFPFLYFLRRDVEDALIIRLVNDICSGQTSILPTRECTKSDRLTIKQFISTAKVRQGITDRIRDIFPDKPAAKQIIYLLRGLLVHRILLLALKKRWNVQYGLHPNRDPISVPFHAKGVPSEQAEWGHPDVAILFTCLAFFYEGIIVTQLRQSLEHLLKSDDPSSEYDRWANGSGNFPDSLRELNAINLDDDAQLKEIWQNVRYNVVVINYFLNNFVFPKHAKQFKMKLQASGWDIPLLSMGNVSVTKPHATKDAGKYSQALTTGFSGTNDNRTMLPLTIKQEDLPGLSHTNAEVLTYLLQRRNRLYVLAADQHGKRLSEQKFLQKLCNMKIRILIDSGAQILEMDNLTLVNTWLIVDAGAPAAVFFDTENKPTVLYRHGSQIPFLATPFADNLGDCLVYLDEAHTRGTDLKLPADARGALTLGLGQTKDHTVQAAMRLRQLATSQSVAFFAPPEVHQSILDLCKKRPGETIDSYHVICWLLEQTCIGIEQLQPLHFSQGADFCRRTQAASENPDFLIQDDERTAYLGTLRQAEQQTLEQLYKPKAQSKFTKTIGSFSPEIAAYMKELSLRRKGFQDTGSAVHGSALQEVEQEREVAYEVEAVREVQKPVHFSPLSFPGLHRDIISFVKTGRLAVGSAGYEQVFVTLRRTSLGIKYGISGKATASKLYVSSEFTRTVSMTRARPDDNFQRPVNWILWCPVTETAIVVIPEEAELVIPLLYENETPLTRLLTYSAPVTRKMLHFNSLNYYAMPSMPSGWKAPMWLMIELGIFAGRLYFEYFEYDDLLEYLGLGNASTALTDAMDDTVAPADIGETEGPVDDAIDETATNAIADKAQSFTKKPLTFLQEWLAVRRKGQDFLHTPMGYVCQGKPLTEDHPFFTRIANGVATKMKAVNAQRMEGAVRVDGAYEDFAIDEETYDDIGYYDGEEDEGGLLDESEREEAETADVIGSVS